MSTTPTGVRIVLITAPDRERAEALAETLVGERLAACVNIVPGIRSIYRFEGSIHRDDEVLLVVKTRAPLFPALEARVRSLHPYTVPEILALDATEGFSGYVAWVLAETRDPSSGPPG